MAACVIPDTLMLESQDFDIEDYVSGIEFSLFKPIPCYLPIILL